MCDTADDMDEYIEYEFARDCIEIADDCDDDDDAAATGVVNIGHEAQSLHDPDSQDMHEQEFLYDDEMVEELDDDVEQMLLQEEALDIKPDIMHATGRQEGQKNDDLLRDKIIEEEHEEIHLLEQDGEENGFPTEDDYQDVEFEEVDLEELEETEEETESVLNKSDTKSKVGKTKEQISEPIKEHKIPKGVARKYMLFDELVATVVDYDADGTPIVEFSISNSDADQRLPVECGICPDVMSRAKITAHLKTHLVPGTNRYQCIYCDETYKDCKYLAGHARRHMGIRPYVCEVCKLYFSTKQDIRVHNQRRHQEKDHICEVCGKTFAQNTQLKRHREATHEKKRRFKCDICPKSYYKNFSLQEHIRAVHMGKRRMIVCPFCGMQCRDAHKMARHRKQMHLHQTHFECNICNEEFTDINYFDAHKRSIQCRYNTRRKLEEEGMLQQQQEGDEQQQQQQQSQQLSKGEAQQEIVNAKHEILIEDEISQQFSSHEHSNEEQLLQDHNDLQLQQQLNQPHTTDDTIETVQIIDECDYKHLISSSPTSHHQSHSGQIIFSNDLLEQSKIEQITPDDVADDDEELVYEITIDSNE